MEDTSSEYANNGCQPPNFTRERRKIENGNNVVQPPNLTRERRKIEMVFSMEGGNGETSYAKNSQGQAKHMQSLRPMLEEALNSLDLPLSQIVRIADLGCSSGQNTLVTANFIVNHMVNKYKLNSLRIPEFQVFFSDLPSTDFNTLFQILPPLMEGEACMYKKEENTLRSYFAAGVPGSFYKRLFPSATLDIVHSSFSLHWLSEVPDVVQEPSSAAWNKGRVFIHRGSPVTANAYREQFKGGLQTFLRGRAEEMKSGGCMFLVCLGRTSPDPTDQGGAGILFGTHFEQSWNDMVEEGLIEAEKLDSFNLPLFAPTAGEFREVVETEKSFEIKKVDIFEAGSPLVVECAGDEDELARAYTNSCRSVCGVLVDHHVGRDLSEQLFSRMEKRAAHHIKEIVDKLQFFHVVSILTRK